MTTTSAITTSNAAVYLPAAASSSSNSVGDFARVLEQQLGASADPGLTGGLGNLGGLSGLSGLSGGGNGALAQLFTLLLVQVIERLLGSDAASTAGMGTAGASAAAASTPEGLPVNGRVSQNYHTGHRAIDLAVPVGTPIHSTMSGKVVHAGWNTQGYGNLVIVENGPYQTYYAHLDSIPVQVGDWVDAGSLVGLSGNTGNSTGPHLHYEVRLNGQPQAPTGA